RSDGEDNIAVQEHRSQVNRALINHVVLVGQGADTGASNNLIAEAVVDIRLVNFVALFVVPGWTWVICPLHQAGHPSQFQNTSSSQVNSTIALQTIFCLEAGTARAPGGNLADTGDDNHVIQVGGDFADLSLRQWSRELDLASVWQGSDGCRCFFGGGIGAAGSSLSCSLFANPRCKLRDGDLGRTPTTGQIPPQSTLCCAFAMLSGRQRHQLRRNLFWVTD